LEGGKDGQIKKTAPKSWEKGGKAKPRWKKPLHNAEGNRLTKRWGGVGGGSGSGKNMVGLPECKKKQRGTRDWHSQKKKRVEKEKKLRGGGEFGGGLSVTKVRFSRRCHRKATNIPVSPAGHFPKKK